MTDLIVIGTSPASDVSVAVGPFRSERTAAAAADELTAKGYNAEVCPLVTVGAVDLSEAWG